MKSRVIHYAAAGLAAVTGAPLFAQTPPLTLDPMVGDHAVLQRNQRLVINGTSAPHERIIMAFGSTTKRGKADSSGRWRLTLPPQAISDARNLIVTGHNGRRVTARDILIGDVWLCSGQSNMEWPVKSARNAEAEIATSANPQIRLLTVPHANDPAMQTRFGGPVPWSIATPSTVAGFSAACYFMARELQSKLKIPLGLIQSTWGGSNIEAWVPASTLSTLSSQKKAIAQNALYAHDREAANARMTQLWQNWWHVKVDSATSPWNSDTGLKWNKMPVPWRDWKTWGLPLLNDHNGMLWYDRNVDLTASQAAQGATLELGAIDEIDQTWVNGRPVGNSFGWATERTYQIEPGTLRAGTNRIALNVYSAWGMGGMLGTADRVALRLADGTRIPLGDRWRYASVPGGLSSPPVAPWYAIGGKTVLYNAMIAPLGPTAIAGVAWYQGESNTGNTNEYEVLLDVMKSGWRRQFGARKPFLIVQLPNFGAASSRPVTSGWATLREAQRRSTQSDQRSALVVTIDLGDPADLHPTNKQDIGLRLARAARSLVYGDAITPSGPRVSSVTRGVGGIAIVFQDLTGALALRRGATSTAFELCESTDASCRLAEAKLTGTGVLLTGPNAVKATRVRYCWGDAPVCDLYDDADLPIGPFESLIARW